LKNRIRSDKKYLR